MQSNWVYYSCHFQRLYATWWHLNGLDVLTLVRYRPALCLRILNSEGFLLHILYCGRGYSAPWCWTQVCDCVVPVLFNLQPMGKSTSSFSRKTLYTVQQFVCILTEVHALRFHHSLEGINVSAVHISLLYFQKEIVFVRGRWYLIVYCVCQIFVECTFSASFFLFSQQLIQWRRVQSFPKTRS